MTFIGLIINKKDEMSLKKYLDSIIKEYKLQINIIIISKNNIENVKNIKFNTIIIHENTLEEVQYREMLKKMMLQTKFLILNSDTNSNLELVNSLELTLITYGLNSKATLTASSLENNEVSICIQREIINNANVNIEPKEICIRRKKSNIYGIMIGYLLYILFS